MQLETIYFVFYIVSCVCFWGFFPRVENTKREVAVFICFLFAVFFISLSSSQGGQKKIMTQAIERGYAEHIVVDGRAEFRWMK